MNCLVVTSYEYEMLYIRFCCVNKKLCIKCQNREVYKNKNEL